MIESVSVECWDFLKGNWYFSTFWALCKCGNYQTSRLGSTNRSCVYLVVNNLMLSITIIFVFLKIYIRISDFQMRKRNCTKICIVFFLGRKLQKYFQSFQSSFSSQIEQFFSRLLFSFIVMARLDRPQLNSSTNNNSTPTSLRIAIVSLSRFHKCKHNIFTIQLHHRWQLSSSCWCRWTRWLCRWGRWWGSCRAGRNGRCSRSRWWSIAAVGSRLFRNVERDCHGCFSLVDNLLLDFFV